MVIHVHNDSAFRRYQKEMRYKPDLWPLYRGFFVEVNLFKASKEKAAEINKTSANVGNNHKDGDDTFSKNGLADEDANLMIKLKFLPYKLRTFLIRNGLSTLFKDGQAAYKTYYLRQMKIWNTSSGKLIGTQQSSSPAHGDAAQSLESVQEERQRTRGRESLSMANSVRINRESC